MSRFLFLLLIIYSECYKYEMTAIFSKEPGSECCISYLSSNKPSSCTREDGEDYKYKIVWDPSIKISSSQNLFKYCSSLLSLDASEFDTSEITVMEGMFMGCTNLQSLNIKNFDTRKVNNMNSMFCSCSHLTTLDISKF